MPLFIILLNIKFDLLNDGEMWETLHIEMGVTSLDPVAGNNTFVVNVIFFSVGMNMEDKWQFKYYKIKEPINLLYNLIF